MIDPRGMSVMDWTDSMAFLLADIVPTEKLLNPENWRQWAVNILDVPTFEGQNAPNPFDFEDWEDWAIRFNEVTDLNG